MNLKAITCAILKSCLWPTINEDMILYNSPHISKATLSKCQNKAGDVHQTSRLGNEPILFTHIHLEILYIVLLTRQVNSEYSWFSISLLSTRGSSASILILKGMRWVHFSDFSTLLTVYLNRLCFLSLTCSQTYILVFFFFFF